MRKQVKPIVHHIFGIADGEQGKVLATRIRHINSGWQKLFEEKESTERRARHLAAKGKINSQGEWHE